MKIPGKIKVVGFVSEFIECHERKMNTTVNNFFFVKKKDDLRKL
jgi:hypothetical protein